MTRDAAPEYPPGPCGFDAELRWHTEALRRAWDIRPNDAVLDIGCGSGQTSRLAAGVAGSVLGVDISPSAIERARALAAGLDNVTFELADAQGHDFPRQWFDLAISRFGTMFFADPRAAFANIAGALRPAGRLAMLVWQSRERNEWDVAIRRSLGVDGPDAAYDGPDAFSFGDPSAVEEILTSAGFADIAFADVHEPVYYGHDVTTALEWVHGFTYTSEVLKRLEPDDAARADERLRETLAAHRTDRGVLFDSRAWIVTAHLARPSIAR
ncbi:SAM-dependent methyltransferase [Nocardia transvalensis]|uniref:SAM-dependent methyltransferase n=1 Tax=Nocardia transvalensis TaxID=37333 RepID=A0A7W9P9V2_9NOCA|nr:class I SAM-dependent methyltransferase [Nocardia transvalensis]MBB5911774.1 SAM-dependent methyltransferase [Nocardia transvalensis]